MLTQNDRMYKRLIRRYRKQVKVTTLSNVVCERLISCVNAPGDFLATRLSVLKATGNLLIKGKLFMYTLDTDRLRFETKCTYKLKPTDTIRLKDKGLSVPTKY